MPNDMLLQLLVHSTIPLACLGYIDQALSRVDEALLWRADHPHPLASPRIKFCLANGWLIRSAPQKLLLFADENSGTFDRARIALFRSLGTHAARLVRWSALGQAEEGITLLTDRLCFRD